MIAKPPRYALAGKCAYSWMHKTDVGVARVARTPTKRDLGRIKVLSEGICVAGGPSFVLPGASLKERAVVAGPTIICIVPLASPRSPVRAQNMATRHWYIAVHDRTDRFSATPLCWHPTGYLTAPPTPRRANSECPLLRLSRQGRHPQCAPGSANRTCRDKIYCDAPLPSMSIPIRTGERQDHERAWNTFPAQAGINRAETPLSNSYDG